MKSNLPDKKAVKMKNIFLIISAILLLILTACDYFEEGDTLDSSTIEFSISGLPAIPDSMTFVAWFENENPAQAEPTIIFEGDAVNGTLNYKSETNLRSLQTAQLFWITVERKSLLDTLPPTTPANSRKILGGRFSNAAVNLGLGENVFNFDNSSVVYNLLTPTDGSNSNELSGIWFVDSVDQEITTGLDLPELFGGWRYEGWVEVNGVLISTGRFNSIIGADQRNIFGGSESPLPFPGEDFINDPSVPPLGLTFPIDLTGAKIFLSLELNDGRNAGTQPGIVLFEGAVPAPAQSRLTYTLNNANSPLPVGNALIKVDLIQ
jgi:hypothetical protein